MLNMWINEARMSLKLYEGCILDYKLNDSVVINLCLNLNELIYSWSWKIAISDCLAVNRSLLSLNGKPFFSGQSYRWAKFQINGWLFVITLLPLNSKDLQNKLQLSVLTKRLKMSKEWRSGINWLTIYY